MNKSDLSRAVYESHGGLSFGDARRIVDLIFDTAKARLAKGEKVLLSGFGCFRVIQRRDKRGVNPRTGESMVIAGRKIISFKPSKFLKSI